MMKRQDRLNHDIRKSNCETQIQATIKAGFAENLKRAVCCIDRRRES